MQFIEPNWPAPSVVKAISTTREGGFSSAPYQSLNLGDHVGDDIENVQRNRLALQTQCMIGVEPPVWLRQVHGTQVHHVDAIIAAGDKMSTSVEGDALYTTALNRPCSIMTADCLPVLFCNQQGTQVAAAHAGWRGLLDGILEATVATFEVGDIESLLVWLGPAIGPTAFEVGEEVRQQFCQHSSSAESAFSASRNAGKWLADINQLAKLRLCASGISEQNIYGGQYCTYSAPETFFSYRREGTTGRMASVIWLSEST